MEALKKERIKDRMLKTASKIWGIAESELEANYDPLVFLIIEACAAEFEKIGHDIQTSQNRLLDKLADIMLPEILLGAQPPSCIMQAKPIDTQITVDPLTRFYCDQRIVDNKKTSSVDIHFTPVGRFPLLNAGLKKILIGDRLYNIKENGSKEAVYEQSNDDGKQVFDIELAIEAADSLASLNQLILFFDLRTHSEAPSFYKGLEHVRAFVKNEPIHIKPGYSLQDQFEFSPASIYSEGCDYSQKIHKQVAGVYKRQFLHIADSRPLTSMITAAPPDSWKNALPEELLKKECSAPMVYITLRLSRPYPRHVLESLMFGVNAFPVVSRKLNSVSYRTNAWINVIPLQINGSFLDLHDVSSATGSYKITNTPGAQKPDEGEAAVRSGGIGKASSKDVRDHVNSLMQAIREESAYFSDISNDMMTNRLREINQILTRLQGQLGTSKDLQDQYSYILLNPKKTGESLNIQYWTTNVDAARQVKAYTQVNSLVHVAVDPKSAYLITGVAGGKSSISESEKAVYLKQQISSRGKIVSSEDVKLLAARLFGSHLRKVEVHKTIEAGTGTNQGFARRINVLIYLQNEGRDSLMTDMTYLAREMEYLLAEQASPLYPYEVTIA